MKRRLLSLFLAFVTILSLLPTAAFAASSEEDALGEVDIYNGDYELGYLAINGAVKKQKYTYFLYESNDGSTKESPAYCVNPNQYGVPQTVGPGESIKYLANEKASDPKVVGIISNGYPHRSLGELGLENKYQAFYATKMALWCYLIPSWDISNLKVAPGLSGDELDRGNRILAAAKDIYKRGTTYNYMLTPRMTVTADKSTAYPVTIGGQEYKQQVFTVWSETWVYNYDVSLAFSDPDSVPEGTKIVDTNNNEITAVTTKYTSDGYAGTFKVLYPADSVEGQSGNVQLSLSAPVAQYAAMYAVCQEKDQYGDLQNYICDLDNKVQLDVAAVSSYTDSGEPDPDETALKIVKLEEGTEIPLEGAVFSVYDPEGKKVGSYSTGPDGTVTIPLTLEGHYTVTEEIPPRYHLLPEETTQHADVEYNKTATLTFWNAPYGSLRVEKWSDTGDALSGVTIQIKHIETGETRTGQTRNGVIVFDKLAPGGWEVRELAGIDGWVADTDTVQTVAVVSGEEDIVTLYFSNAPKGAVLVKKVSSADNSPLSDVEFLVARSDGSVVGNNNGKFVTDSTGTFLVEGVEPGTTLVIKETRAKPGYLLDNTPQTVQVQEGQTVTVEFRNQPMGNLIIHKLSSKDKTPLEGVQFKITYADGSYLLDEGGKLSSNGLYWTNEEGQIVLSGINGTVVVTEVESIPGYTIDPDTQSQTVVVNPDDTQQLYFYNAPVGGVELIKVNEADKTERIPNTTFEIRRVSDDTLVDTVTTGKNGRVYLPLESGDYYAVETEAADGFKLDDTPIYFTVKDGETTRKTVTNKAFSGILIHKVDPDGHGIPGVTFLLYDSGKNPIGQYTSDNRGYVYIEDLTESGRYYLRELENEGYVPDTELKTVYVKSGRTTEITWENIPITGQIQIIKKSADYNPTTGLPAGTLLEGAIFEIYDRAGNLVDTIRSDSRGLAVSKQLPLSRYTIREVKAPNHYGVNETELTAYLEHEGQIVRFEVTNKSLTTGVSITKTGPKEIMGGQPVRYTFSGIANTSNVRLDSFYWRDTIPAQVRLDTVITGTYNFPGTYKITYRVNGGEYRTLADNLSTSQTYTLAASPAALGLASNERVTEIMFVFGQAPAGFAQVETPYLNCTAVANLPANSSFVNIADVGGVYNGTWVQAISRWVTTVYGKPTPLPRTGY